MFDMFRELQTPIQTENNVKDVHRSKERIPHNKSKVKSLPGAFSTLRPRGPIVFLPQQVPAFISRGATHHTDVRDLYQRRRELPLNFASGSEFTRILLGYFTCRKAGAWDILFYFLSEGRHTENFSDA
jgi:hypothetical protein